MQPETLKKVIQQGESANVEFKIAPPRYSELAERLCGFANSSGGRLIIGVEDTTWQIVGVKKVSEAIDSVLQAARLCKPTIRLDPPEPEVIELENDKAVVVASVAPNDGILYQTGGVCWIRRGTHTVPLEVSEIEEILYSRGSLTWEQRAVPRATLDDLNLELVKLYLEQRPARSRLGGRLSNLEEVLINLGCAVPVQESGQKIIRPTNAGLLLFGLNPQLYLIQAEVICMLYGDSLGLRRYTDRRILYGTITQQIDQVESFFEQHIPVAARMEGFHRIDEPDYPLDALREAIVNALVHRDYSLVGEAVRIFYYSDRIELHNPGLLMPGLRLEEVQQGQARSKPRNPIIAGILRDLPGGYMERVGSGISYMIHQMDELGKPKPEFKEQGEFIVTFRRTAVPADSITDGKLVAFNSSAVASPTSISPQVIPVNERTIPLAASNSVALENAGNNTGLANVANSETQMDSEPKNTPFSTIIPGSRLSLSQVERQERGLHYIQKYGSITNKQYRTITGASDNTALRDLDALVAQGTLRAIGQRRSRKYVL